MATSEVIRLVRGDNLPVITLTFTTGDGAPLNLGSSQTEVVVRFRSVTSESTLKLLPVTKINNGVGGEASFSFPGNTLDVEPGFYEAEIELRIDGGAQTNYERIKFLVREQF